MTGQPATGQQIIVNSQGQLIQGAGVVQAQPAKVMLNAQGQQIIVNNSQQQVIQVNPSNIVSSGGQLIVNQAGQVVQQRIVNSHGQIVAQGMVHGQVIASGMQNRVVQQPQPAPAQPAPTNNQIPLGQVIQRIVHPGGRIEEKVVQATPVAGQPGQMMIPGTGQVIQIQQQPQQQQQQIVVCSGAGVQVSSGGQVISSTGGGQMVRTVTVPVSQVQMTPQQVAPLPVSAAPPPAAVSQVSTELSNNQPRSPILQDLLKTSSNDSDKSLVGVLIPF